MTGRETKLWFKRRLMDTESRVQDVAEVTGISKAVLFKYSNGQRCPSRQRRTVIEAGFSKLAKKRIEALN